MADVQLFEVPEITPLTWGSEDCKVGALCHNGANCTSGVDCVWGEGCATGFECWAGT